MNSADENCFKCSLENFQKSLPSNLCNRFTEKQYRYMYTVIGILI